jgi:hypothetical protein
MANKHTPVRELQMRTASIVALTSSMLACALLVVAAGAATRSAAICNPAYGYCDPGQLHAGVYTTRYFLPGMRVNVPGTGWISQQDSTTEFKLSPPGYSGSQAPTIRFWIDPRVTTPCTDIVLPYKMTTPARAVHWFTTSPNLVVSDTKRTTVAGHIPALRIDYNASPNAPVCPGARGPGADYFAFFGGPQPDATDLAAGHTPGIKDGFGTGDTEPVRIYFAHIGSRSHSHLFAVGVDSPGEIDVAGLRADAAKMLAHLRLPTKLPRTGQR